MKSIKSGRIASIDVFRALTMLLMIWVNDFWTLDNIPKWLEHAKAGEDYLGFSDLIFPWFLFIVGMSIPFAIRNRIKKGDNNIRILKHILTRSLALLIMGVFLVNTESYHAEATGLGKPWFVILMTTGFFMVWNVYPVRPGKMKYLYQGLQITGMILLVYLAVVYRGTEYGEENTTVIMQTRWWGILGLIGWTYLIAAPVYLYFKNAIFIIWLFWLAFIGLNILGSNGIAYNIFSWQDKHWVIGDGAFHAFAFGGVITSILLSNIRDNGKTFIFYVILAGMSLFFFIGGCLSREFFIISKISATPPWVFYSMSTAFILFIILHFVVDMMHKESWFAAIKPAGTATLTCYLIPYFFYSFRTLLGIGLPDFLRTGIIGLVKSMIYAFFIIGIAWLLGKMKIKLKI